jgi:hypothetical protein
MRLAPNGPRNAGRSTATRPAASAVTEIIAGRLQSPGPVACPFTAHSTTASGVPGVKPVPWTWIVCRSRNPRFGVMVTRGCAAAVRVTDGVGVGVADRDAVGDSGGAERTTLEDPLPQAATASSDTADAAAART